MHIETNARSLCTTPTRLCPAHSIMHNIIMEYGSTPMFAVDVIFSIYEPYLSFSSVFITDKTNTVAGEQKELAIAIVYTLFD